MSDKGEYKQPEYPPIEGPEFGFGTIEQELQFRRAQAKHDLDDLENLTTFALRVEPVCLIRNSMAAPISRDFKGYWQRKAA